MADELKDQRVPIMMTPSELKAIDDWSFNRRIRSRGEAIRRLCQIALIADDTPLMKLAMHVISHSIEEEKYKEQFSTGKTFEEDVRNLCRAIMEERSKMIGFSGDETVEEAMEAVKSLSEEFKRTFSIPEPG